MSVGFWMFEDIQNQKLRFIAMVEDHQSQKQRALSTFLISNHFHLHLLASQTRVDGLVVADALADGVCVGHRNLGGCCRVKYTLHRDGSR